MPFETPWAKRKRMQVESREGCEGAVEYARKLKLILDEFLRITGDVTKRGVFRQRDYSYVLGLVQEQEKLVPPPAALELHAAMLELLHATRFGIRDLDPTGDQSVEEINQVFDEAERIFVQSVAAPWERFNAICFPGDTASLVTPPQNQFASTPPELKEVAVTTGSLPGRVDPAAVDRARLALFLRHQGRTTISSSLQDMASLSAHLDRLAASPHLWQTLNQEWISLLGFHQLVSHGPSSEPRRVQALLQFYEHVIATLGTRSRLTLEGDVAGQLGGLDTDYQALVPFMALDPAAVVVSTAAMDTTTLIPLENGNPLTGPATVVDMAMGWIESDETRAAAMIAGVLMLGDARILPRVGGCWRKLGQAGKNILMEQQSGSVFAANVEFFLRWIETVDENDFGHPAGALARMADGMIRHPGVRDVERKFPAPLNSSDEALQSDSPVRVLQEWTKEDFARTIEPRLRMAYMRETYDKVIPRVLLAWGLEVGEDEPEDQLRRMVQSWNWSKSQLALIDSAVPVGSEPPWEVRARSTIASIFRTLPVETAIPRTFEEVNRLQREADDRRSSANDHKGSSMYGRLKQAGLHFDLEAKTIMRHVQHCFGSDPRSSLMIMETMRRVADSDQSENTGENEAVSGAMTQFDLREYGEALSTALEVLGIAADERNQAIQVMKHPGNMQEVLAAARIASAAPTKVDGTLEVFITTMPPDDCISLHEAFMFATTELLRQWRAELAAFGANLTQNEADAAARASEAQSAEAAFSRWWTDFKRALQAVEHDQLDLTNTLLTPLARGVVKREDLNRASGT